MANRAQRRQQEREQIREWRKQGQMAQVLSLQRNGIREKDLDAAYKNGYENGYMFAAEGFMKKMYAAIAKELVESGNSSDDVISFLHNVDHRFAIMFDADDEIEEVYEMTGIHFNIDRNAIDRIQEVAR